MDFDERRRVELGEPFVFNGLEYSIEVFDVSGEEEMERVEGIEPSTKAWEAFVLPLNYTRLSSDPPRPALCRLVMTSTRFGAERFTRTSAR